MVLESVLVSFFYHQETAPRRAVQPEPDLLVPIRARLTCVVVPLPPLRPLPPRRDAPPRPSVQRGSASPFKDPMLVGLLLTNDPLTARPGLLAGQLFVCACAHRDSRGSGERRVEVPAPREFLSLASNLPLGVSFSL